MSEAIEGKIASIVDERTVIINRGASADVREGMKFVIFVEGDSVKDPDSGESLGTWEIVKGYVSAAHIQEKITVCIVSRPDERNSSKGPSKTLSSAMVEVSFNSGDTDEKLAVRSSEMAGRPRVGPVAIGDRVRSIES